MATHVITTRRADLLAAEAHSAATRRLGELLALFNDWLAERRAHRATVAKLTALPDELLADIGVSRADIDPIARRLAQKARAGR